MYGNAELDRRLVYVGEPAVCFISGSTNPICNRYGQYFYASSTYSDHLPSDIYFEWQTSPHLNYIAQFDWNGAEIYFESCHTGYQVFVRAYNSCGTGPWTSLSVYTDWYSPAPFTYPNPVSDILSVEIDQQTVARSQTATVLELRGIYFHTFGWSVGYTFSLPSLSFHSSIVL